MFSEDFLRQFWSEFLGSVVATLFLALLTFGFTYITRLHIARFFRRMHRGIKHTLEAEEARVKKK